MSNPNQSWNLVDRTHRGSSQGGSQGGYRGGSQGGSRGGTQGGSRGGSRGSFGGDARGGSTHRGRGTSTHSDRGRRGGSQGSSYREPAQVLVQTTTTPNNQVHGLEDQLVPPNLSGDSTTNVIARRPGYSTKGTPVLLYANYFELALKTSIYMHCYSVSVIQGQNQTLPSGKKLTRIIQLLLRQVGEGKQLVTDFGSTIISKERLFSRSQTEKEYSISYSAEDSQSQANLPVYRLLVKHTNIIAVQQLLDYLSSAVIDDPNPQVKQATIQALNIIVGHGLKVSNRVAVEKNKYFAISDPAHESFELGPGLNALRGFFLSVRPTTGRILINAQIKHLASYRPARVDQIMTSLGYQDGCSEAVFKQIERFIKGMPVMLTHFVPNRPKKLFGLASPKDSQNSTSQNPPRVPRYGATAREVEFYIEAESRYYNVAQYFAQKYNITRHSNFPVVNIGTTADPKYILAELCRVSAGQQFRSKLSPDHTKNMIRGAVRSPFANATSIKDQGVRLLQAYSTTNLETFGVELNTDLVVVNGRVLDAPQLLYNAKGTNAPQPLQPENGEWRPFNIQGLFSDPARLASNNLNFLWIRLRGSSNQSYSNRGSGNPGSSNQGSSNRGSRNQGPSNRGSDNQAPEEGFANFEAVQESVEKMRRSLINNGVRITDKTLIRGHELEIVDEKNCQTAIDQKFQEICDGDRNRQLQVLLIVLPSDGRYVYNAVKRAGDITYGIHTICVTPLKFRQAKPDYLGNIALKFNLKMGGRNQAIDIRALHFLAEARTMVVGLDVTHPAPGENQAPSIAAIVASADRFLGQWPAEVRIQARRQEMVEGLKEMFVGRLRHWVSQQTNNGLPDNILVYRDGVSEGQYDIVREEELPKIKEACREVYPPSMTRKGLPKIAIVVVGKRHHTRFYPVNLQDANEQTGNVKNGTVVDRGVTETRYWDFYLHAHKSLLGTAKSAHYVVVHDEIFRPRAEEAIARSSTSVTPQRPVGTVMADMLEEITHKLCYMFGRANKAVSVCPPAYYADVACERARCWLSRMFSDFDPITRTQLQDAQAREVQIHPNLENTMFYL